MKPRAGVCVQCVAVLLGSVSALATGSAIASSGPMADVDAAVWVGLACTVFCSLVAGYARGIDRRLGSQETFSQGNRDMIATLRADMLRDHTSKAETREHREDVKANFERVHERLDQLLNIVGSRRGDHHP